MSSATQGEKTHYPSTSRLPRLSIKTDVQRLLLSSQESIWIVCKYGQCSKCSCQAYQGSDQVCGNCGHNYDAHY